MTRNRRNPSESGKSYCILRYPPVGSIAVRWRESVIHSDFPTHYTAPEYFLEPSLRSKKPFAVLSLAGEDVTAVLTGIHQGDHVQSGLSVRPQIAFSRHADREAAFKNLLAGLLQEAKASKLVDLFVWSGSAETGDPRFRPKPYEGVVMLDLTRGPDSIFRRFSQTRRNDIRKAIKSGVSVAAAKNRDDISAFYAVYVDWSRRKALPVIDEDEFQEMFSLTGNRMLLLAHYNEQVIAGVVVRFFPRGVMEYAANSSLLSALHLRPNDLLQWRAIEWGCAEGMTKYSLGGTHLFSRKSGGEIVPVTRLRLDLSMFRRYAVGDWIAERAERARPLIPQQMLALGRSLRNRLGA